MSPILLLKEARILLAIKEEGDHDPVESSWSPLLRQNVGLQPENPDLPRLKSGQMMGQTIYRYATAAFLSGEFQVRRNR
jgi:hypothetical protein